MGRKSKIDRLPAEVRELIVELRHNGRTIDEILEKLHELDVDVTRSTLARKTQEIDQLAEQLENSRAIAEAVMARIEDQPMGQVARLNIELLHSAITKLAMGQDIRDSREAMFLSTALQKLASAAKVDLDRELKVRDETLKKAAAEVDDKARQLGLTRKTADAIRREILGIRTDA